MVNVKTIGITGGNGFIGSVIKEYFSKKKIDLIDYTCDLSLETNILDSFQEKGFPDVLIHFAGRFSDDTSLLIKDNLISTNNLLKVISSCNSNTHVIFSSTGAIYGDSGKNPISEEFMPKPNTTYGLIKFWCEQAISYYERIGCCKSTILRFPSVYGHHNNKGIIYEWMRTIHDSNQINILGDGEQYRSFLNAEDIPETLVKIINNEIFGIYNMSYPECYSLNELASLFVKKFDCNLVYGKRDFQNNLQSMVISPDKLIKKIDWNSCRSIVSFLDKI